MHTLSLQNIETITDEFYSHFCGVPQIARLSPGTHFICSPEREEILKGFGCRYTIYVLCKDDLCVISYAPQHEAFMQTLKGAADDQIVAALTRKFPFKQMQLMVFKKELVTQYDHAKVLSADDYPLYEAFFRAIHPAIDPDADDHWLKQYFLEKAAKEYFTGYLADGKLLSVCDPPDMPYMEDRIQHTGINTLLSERRKGYARCTAALAAHRLIQNGVCPQWECLAQNTASVKLAHSIGYEKYADAYILEE